MDGVLHSIGFAPPACLGGGFLDAGWDDVKVALEVSAYSLKLLAAGFRPLFQAAGGGSVVGLDFDATVAWPGYDWMGVAKAALESTARYLARDLGPDRIRVNLVAAGPIKTMAAKSIPGFSRFEEVWDERAPLGWSVTDPEPVARACVALLSDWFPATTGRDGARRWRLPRHGGLGDEPDPPDNRGGRPAGSCWSRAATGASGWPSPTPSPAAGDRVAVTHRTDPVEGFLSVPCDVTSAEDVEAAFASVEAELGPVEVLVSNAGVNADTLLLSMKEEAWSGVIDANLTGAYRVARRATSKMIRARRGRIIFISSVVALTGSAGQTNYAASKAGLDRVGPITGPRDRRAWRHRQRGGAGVRHHGHDR